MKLLLEIPDSAELNSMDVKCFVASKLYEAGKLSLGQAAEMTGLTKTLFAEVLHKYDVSFINYPVSEMINDAAAI